MSNNKVINYSSAGATRRNRATQEKPAVDPVLLAAIQALVTQHGTEAVIDAVMAAESPEVE